MDPEETDDEFETEEFDELDETEEVEEQLEEEAPEGGETVEEEPPAKPVSRSQRRIEALDREAKEARERAEAAERRLQEIQSGVSRSEAERRAEEHKKYLESLDPWDRVKAETQSELQAIRRTVEDSTDRADFTAACASNPALAKVKDEVEKQLREARSRGVDVPRRTLAAYILGEQILEKGPKAKAVAEKRAAANRDRERTRASNGGISEAPTRGREANDKAARDKRLESYRF